MIYMFQEIATGVIVDVPLYTKDSKTGETLAKPHLRYKRLLMRSDCFVIACACRTYPSFIRCPNITGYVMPEILDIRMENKVSLCSNA